MRSLDFANALRTASSGLVSRDLMRDMFQLRRSFDSLSAIGCDTILEVLDFAHAQMIERIPSRLQA